jgi:ribokinase
MLTVFGSINIDLTFLLPHLPATGETVLSSTCSQATGGKGANQAAAAARDGAAIRFIGCVGDDSLGATARAALADLGVDVGDLETVPGTTGVAAVWIDGEGNNQIAVASGANAALRAEALLRRPLARDAFVVLQMETPAAEVAAAIAHVRRAGARVILNLAPALPLPRPALEQVDVLVVNEHEAAVLCERLELPLRGPAAQAAGLAGCLGSTVIVTLGAAGAIAARHDEVLRVDALSVNAVDTTGAGDCFVGVLAAALARGASLHAAMRRAVIAGSLACMVVGAMPSFPGRAQIDAALQGTRQGP